MIIKQYLVFATPRFHGWMVFVGKSPFFQVPGMPKSWGIQFWYKSMSSNLVRSWSKKRLLLRLLRSQAFFVCVENCFWIGVVSYFILDILPIIPNILGQINTSINTYLAESITACFEMFKIVGSHHWGLCTQRDAAESFSRVMSI